MRRFLRALLLLAMLAVVGASLAAMYLLPGVHLAEGARRVLPCDELPGRAIPSLGSRHLSYLGERHEAYNSVPPTSGPHMPWLISGGVYRRPIPREYQVHLLEHGKVLVQYPVGASEELRTALERFARRRSDVVVTAPDPEVSGGVALTAWQRLELLPAYDSERVQRFVDALAGRYDHGWAGDAGDCVHDGS